MKIIMKKSIILCKKEKCIKNQEPQPKFTLRGLKPLTTETHNFSLRDKFEYKFQHTSEFINHSNEIQKKNKYSYEILIIELEKSDNGKYKD